VNNYLVKTDEIFEIAEQHRLCDPAHCHCWDAIAVALRAARDEALEEAASSLELHADFLDRTKRFLVDPDFVRERADGLRSLKGVKP
jgi:hypothetical protein